MSNALEQLNDNDVLADVRTRIEQLKTAEGYGYSPAIVFYKRIADEIQRLRDMNGLAPLWTTERLSLNDTCERARHVIAELGPQDPPLTFSELLEIYRAARDQRLSFLRCNFTIDNSGLVSVTAP